MGARHLDFCTARSVLRPRLHVRPTTPPYNRRVRSLFLGPSLHGSGDGFIGSELSAERASFTESPRRNARRYLRVEAPRRTATVLTTSRRIAAVGLLALACLAAAQRPPAQTAGAATDTIKIPFESYTLANGLTVSCRPTTRRRPSRSMSGITSDRRTRCPGAPDSRTCSNT